MEVGSRPPALAPPPGDPAGETPGLVVLGRAECEELLRHHSLGRIGFVVDGWPVVLPVNYVMDGDDIVLRTDPATKLAAGTHWSVPVVLEVDAALTFFEPGWSVLAHGIAVEVRDEKERRRLPRPAPRAVGGGHPEPVDPHPRRPGHRPPAHWGTSIPRVLALVRAAAGPAPTGAGAPTQRSSVPPARFTRPRRGMPCRSGLGRCRAALTSATPAAPSSRRSQ